MQEAANGYKLADIMSAFCDKEARVQQWLDDPSESNMEAFQAEFDTFILNLDVSDTDRAKEFRKYDQEQVCAGCHPAAAMLGAVCACQSQMFASMATAADQRATDAPCRVLHVIVTCHWA